MRDDETSGTPGGTHAGTHRGLLLLAVGAGMAAIVSLPLALQLPGAQLLVYALPLVLATMGRVLARPGLLVAAVVALLAATAAIAFSIGPLGLTLLLLGPVTTVVVLGPVLRDIDLVAAAGFLLSATIAVIAGFATAAMDGSVALVLGVATIGVVLVALRLRRA